MTESSPFKTEVVTGDSIGIGKTYPLFGQITSILEDSYDKFTVIINYTVKLSLKPKLEMKEHIKSRFLESGIFITKITAKNLNYSSGLENLSSLTNETVFPYEGEVETVILGKRQERSD